MKPKFFQQRQTRIIRKQIRFTPAVTKEILPCFDLIDFAPTSKETQLSKANQRSNVAFIVTTNTTLSKTESAN